MLFILKVIVSILLISGTLYSPTDCLFKNPLCFYNTDILSYLQVLHKNQQYDKMMPYFYGFGVKPEKIKKILENSSFGYSLKRVGIKAIKSNEWSLTYQRTLYGTNENFKINCKTINDTCRIIVDTKTLQTIFEK